MEFTHDCIIIGGGPAGLTASIYLQRFLRRTLVINGGESRVSWAPEIHNLIGFPKCISGEQLLDRLRAQARRYNSSIVSGNAVVYKIKCGFKVSLNDSVYTTRFVILAIGVKDAQPPLPNLRQLTAKKLLAYCPICDGYDYSGKKMALLVNSQSVLKKVRYLYGFSKNLHVVFVQNRKLNAKLKSELQKMNVSSHIGELQNLSFDSKSGKLIVSLKHQRPLKVDLAYVQFGAKISRTAVSHLKKLKTTKSGRFLVTKHQQTSIKGLYAIGDCANSLAQINVAAGEAAIAATDVHNQLSKL